MNKEQIAILLRDMASTFVAQREDAHTYVCKRYRWMTTDDRNAKVAQVRQRVQYAKAIAKLSRVIADHITGELNAKVSEDSLS